MKYVSHLLCDELNLVVTPEGQPFKIIDFIPVHFMSPLILSHGGKKLSINCGDLLSVFEDVKIHFAPLMTERFYKALFKAGKGGNDIDCDAMYEVLSHAERFFNKPPDRLVQQIKDMHIYEACMGAFKEERYYQLSEGPYLVNAILPISLLTLPRLKSGTETRKKAYMLHYDLFKTMFLNVGNNVLVFTDTSKFGNEYITQAHIHPMFWKAFFEAIIDSPVSPKKIKLYQPLVAPSRYVKSSIFHFDDNFKLYEHILKQKNINIKIVHSNPVSVASKQAIKHKVFAVVFGDPEEIFGSRVGGKFNERKKLTFHVEQFASRGTSCLTSLGLVKPTFHTHFSYKDSSFLAKVSFLSSVKQIRGKRVTFSDTTHKDLEKLKEKLKLEAIHHLTDDFNAIKILLNQLKSKGFEVKELTPKEIISNETIEGLRNYLKDLEAVNDHKNKDFADSIAEQIELLIDHMVAYMTATSFPEPTETKPKRSAIKKVRFAVQ